jgi:hypothetical protein
VRDGRLDGVRIIGNGIRGVFDVSIAVYAGFAFSGGTASGIEVSDVHIAENQITTAGTPSIHVWVVSGTTVFEPGGLVEDNVLRNLSIVGNETSGVACTAGIQLQAGQNEIGGETVRGNRLEGASLVDNSVAQCGRVSPCSAPWRPRVAASSSTTSSGRFSCSAIASRRAR